jgi:hypothetical protein
MKETQTTNPEQNAKGNDEKSQHISDRRNGPNGANGCCPFLAIRGPLGNGHPSQVCCATPRKCRLVLDSSVTRFSREASLGLNSEEASSSPKDDGFDEVNEAILLALSDELFSSERQIARRICVPKSTVYRRLVDSLHFSVRHQTFSLGCSQVLQQSKGKSRRVESSRVELSIQLRGLLLSIRHQG